MNDLTPSDLPSSREITKPSRVERVRQAAPNITRVIAIAVLIPTVPLLFASVGALALFYLSPERFGRFLERLPGDNLIRSALVFAPATLFAVVILAVLYALEKPGPAVAVAVRRRAGASWADRAVLVGLPLLLLSAGVWVARFIAPGRFASLLEPLPATAYLQRLVTFAPPLLFLGVLLASLLSLASRSRSVVAEGAAEGAPREVRWERVSSGASRMAAGLILVPALPLLLFSVAGLGLYLASPEVLEKIVEKLSQASVIRLALIFTPAVSLALVLMAVLYLFAPSSRPSPTVQTPGRADTTRQLVASVILLSGIGATALIGLGMLGAITWLLLR